MYYFNIIKGCNKDYFGPLDLINVTQMAIILERIDQYEYPMNPDKFMPESQPSSKGFSEPPDFKEPIIDPR